MLNSMSSCSEKCLHFLCVHYKLVLDKFILIATFLSYCLLCTSTGLYYHIRNIRFDNAVLRVEVNHGKWPALSGNTT